MVDIAERTRQLREVTISQPATLIRAEELLRNSDYSSFIKLWEEYERRVVQGEARVVCLARRDKRPSADLFVPALKKGSHPLTGVPVQDYHALILHKFQGKNAWEEGTGNLVAVGAIDLLAQALGGNRPNGPQIQNYIIFDRFSKTADPTQKRTARYECHIESNKPGSPRITWSLREATAADLKVAYRIRPTREVVNG